MCEVKGVIRSNKTHRELSHTYHNTFSPNMSITAAWLVACVSLSIGYTTNTFRIKLLYSQERVPICEYQFQHWFYCILGQ